MKRARGSVIAAVMLGLAVGSVVLGAVALWRRDVAERATFEAAVAARDQVIAVQQRIRARLSDDAAAARELVAENERRIASLRRRHAQETRLLEQALRTDPVARAWSDDVLPDAVRLLRADPAAPSPGPGNRHPDAASGP